MNLIGIAVINVMINTWGNVVFDFAVFPAPSAAVVAALSNLEKTLNATFSERDM